MEIIVIILVILFLIVYICLDKKENYFNSPSYEEDLYKLKQIEINENNYLKFLKERQDIDNNFDLKFGYSITDETNQDTLGFCPLGKYYKRDKDEEFKRNTKNLDKCVECKNCREKPGWYIEEGCLGDQDSKCKYGNIPLDLYLKGHHKLSYFHNALPQHKHKYKEGEVIKETTINHYH